MICGHGVDDGGYIAEGVIFGSNYSGRRALPPTPSLRSILPSMLPFSFCYHENSRIDSQVMKGELEDECDYSREASLLARFGSPAFLGDDPRFKVPWVWEGSTSMVLVMEHVDGVSVGDPFVRGLSQMDRDEVSYSSSSHPFSGQ